jgi:hypothetical protein
VQAFEKPPGDVPPARLFRALLQRHPERALRYRIPGAEAYPLRVRAVRAAEIGLLLDAAEEGVEELRGSRVSTGLLAHCLWTGTAPAFGHADELGALSSPVVGDLWDEAVRALGAISPTYNLSEYGAWGSALEEGARAGGNLHDAFTLAGCVDVSMGSVTPRPERYWGCSPAELLDGHWMIFRASRAVYLAATAKGPK